MTEDTKVILDRLDKVDSRLDKVDSRLAKVDSRLAKVDSRLAKADSRLDKVDSRLDSLDLRLNSLDYRVEQVETATTEIHLTLENEIRKNIQFVAEGHMNLDYKLNEALKVEEEKEMLLIRVNMLESDVRKLKQG